jgi:hypothetical protein
MAKSAEILRRIAGELGGPEALARLVQLGPRDLHSLLLHLHEEEAAKKSPQDLLARFAEAPAFALSYVDPRLSLRFAAAAFDAADSFEAIELSPVCPLGTISTLSGIHQNWVLSASRGAEIVADPTPVLALECARRRREVAARTTQHRLSTSQRLMRMQPTPAGLLPHFRLFALTTAMRHAPAVEAAALREQLAVYLRLFGNLARAEFRFDDLTVSVSHTGIVEAWLAASGQDREEIRRSVRTEVWNDPDALLKARGLSAIRGRAGEIGAQVAALPRPLRSALEELDTHVLSPLQQDFPGVTLRLDLGRLEGLGYYDGPCVRIAARDRSGAMLPLVDGGFTRWTQRLLGDSRERFLITGIGSDLACARYRI